MERPALLVAAAPTSSPSTAFRSDRCGGLAGRRDDNQPEACDMRSPCSARRVIARVEIGQGRELVDGMGAERLTSASAGESQHDAGASSRTLRGPQPRGARSRCSGRLRSAAVGPPPAPDRANGSTAATVHRLGSRYVVGESNFGESGINRTSRPTPALLPEEVGAARSARIRRAERAVDDRRVASATGISSTSRPRLRLLEVGSGARRESCPSP